MIVEGSRLPPERMTKMCCGVVADLSHCTTADILMADVGSTVTLSR